jgi:hypothetical protein
MTPPDPLAELEDEDRKEHKLERPPPLGKHFNTVSE